MGKLIDRTGEVFGKLVVLSRGEDYLSNKGKPYVTWNCACECGNVTNVIVGNLRSGKVNSCGCEQRLANYKHGMYASAEYSTWEGVIQRCTNPKNEAYKNYGGRSITICESWKTFENFYKDMGDKPEGFTLERKDNSKGYCAENCVWATRSDQNRNKRPYSNTGIKGIHLNKNSGKYEIYCSGEKGKIHLGTADNLEDAKILLTHP